MDQNAQEKTIMMNADEVAKLLMVSKSKAYSLMHEWNQELEMKGKLTIRGRINREYFIKKTSI